MRVTGQDQSKLDFTFSNEQLNAPVAPALFTFHPPPGRSKSSRRSNRMADFVLKYADTRGEVHSQVAQGTSAQEIRERYTQPGLPGLFGQAEKRRAEPLGRDRASPAAARSSISKNS